MTLRDRLSVRAEGARNLVQEFGPPSYRVPQNPSPTQQLVLQWLLGCQEENIEKLQLFRSNNPSQLTIRVYPSPAARLTTQNLAKMARETSESAVDDRASPSSTELVVTEQKDTLYSTNTSSDSEDSDSDSMTQWSTKTELHRHAGIDPDLTSKDCPPYVLDALNKIMAYNEESEHQDISLHFAADAELIKSFKTIRTETADEDAQTAFGLLWLGLAESPFSINARYGWDGLRVQSAEEGSLLIKSLLPNEFRNLARIKPIWLGGYSNELEPTDIVTIQKLRLGDHSQALFPFLAAVSEDIKGSSREAEYQIRTLSFALLNNLMRLKGGFSFLTRIENERKKSIIDTLELSLLGQEGPPTVQGRAGQLMSKKISQLDEICVFTLHLTREGIILYVHYTELVASSFGGVALQYRMSQVKTWAFLKDEDVLEAKMYIWSIIQWGLESRKPKIMDFVKALTLERTRKELRKACY
ncbi:hypothetical protein PVAG01_07857 [Phlyctema vagabunda]|uniref:Uncharacterized protein n=1 Tax=Phlyctema vagabunda TaxID=108571 RepID=A0ABR4PDP1_9HELO